MSDEKKPAEPGRRYAKAIESRQRILNTALDLFLSDGFEQTTMRRIAQRAGMTPGAAYYYFPSKEHIIFHYYEQSYTDHLDAAHQVLNSKKKLSARIAGIIKAHIDVASPYQDVARALFRVASDPTHTLSPFSDESKPLRDQNIELFHDAINGASDRVPANLKDRLPELFWLYKILIITYWVFDDSVEQIKTYGLIERSTEVLVKMINLSRLPGVGKMTEQLLNVLDEYKVYK